MCKSVIVIGAGGHAKAIADIILNNKDKLIGFLDDNIRIGTKVLGYEVIDTINNIEKYKRGEFSGDSAELVTEVERKEEYSRNKEIEFIIGIGNNEIRKRIAEENIGLKYYTAIHPKSIIGLDVCIGQGTAIMAGAIINTCSKIGKHVIINTGAVIEHDNNIEDYVHISPNVSLGGTAQIGALTHIGIGSVIKNNIKIAEDTVVGAGAVVVKDILNPGIYVGNPLRTI